MFNIRERIKRIFGPQIQLLISLECKKEFYGSVYGGFFVNPDIIDEGSVVYSFGIGEEISFDLALINKHNCKVFGFDPTPKSINWVESHVRSANFFLRKYGVAKMSGMATFYLPINEKHVSGSYIAHSNVNAEAPIKLPMKSFQDIITEHAHNKIDVLKMDIEGGEYEVIPTILEAQMDIKQILVEFHHRFYKDGLEKTRDTISLLEANGYKLFAATKSGQEISFVKDDAL